MDVGLMFLLLSCAYACRDPEDRCSG